MIQPKGWVLAFHPDLSRGTSLGRNIKDYNFFSYDVTPISEIAYEIGFKYPAHFSRFFKQRVGHSPNEYRSLS